MNPFFLGNQQEIKKHPNKNQVITLDEAVGEKLSSSFEAIVENLDL